MSVTLKPPVPKVAIIGLGLIGGSWVKGLRLNKAVACVVGFDRNQDSMQMAIELGVIDRSAASPAEAVADADVVILSVPILATHEILLAIKDALKPGAIITDVGSVKGNVEAAIRDVFKADVSNFVLGHPIAGSEKSGITAADLICQSQGHFNPLS